MVLHWPPSATETGLNVLEMEKLLRQPPPNPLADEAGGDSTQNINSRPMPNKNTKLMLGIGSGSQFSMLKMRILALGAKIILRRLVAPLRRKTQFHGIDGFLSVARKNVSKT